jgi:hypothetical protein
MLWTTMIQFPAGKGTFLSLAYPDQLWGPLSLLSGGYYVFFPQGQNDQGMKVTTQLYPAPRSKMCGAIPLLPYMHTWHCAWLSTGNTLPLLLNA